MPRSPSAANGIGDGGLDGRGSSASAVGCRARKESSHAWALLPVLRGGADRGWLKVAAIVRQILLLADAHGWLGRFGPSSSTTTLRSLLWSVSLMVAVARPWLADSQVAEPSWRWR